eukprot:m.215613 g.215613  ORF g.215613 m.215613 type:complete len:76 (-) comp25623_c0_seq1:11-238(-)
MSTISAVSTATSVPAPIATPTSAAASAGESLMPSPTCKGNTKRPQSVALNRIGHRGTAETRVGMTRTMATINPES